MPASLKKLNAAPVIDYSLPDCPFCGSSPQVEHWHGGGPNKRMISCSNAECEVSPSVTGETLRQAVASWSRRA